MALVAFITCLACLVLTLRIIQLRRQVAYLQYDLDEARDDLKWTEARCKNWQALADIRAGLYDDLEKQRDRLANDLVVWKDAVAEERLLRNEAEDIANEAMRVGWETRHDGMLEHWSSGYSDGYDCAISYARRICRQNSGLKAISLIKKLH
jgi:hypothetical protein